MPHRGLGVRWSRLGWGVVWALLGCPTSVRAQLSPGAILFPESSGTQVPASSRIAAVSSVITTLAEPGSETPTSFAAFQRYPENYPWIATPANGAPISGVALREDDGHTIWFVVFGIWKYEVTEDWEFRRTHQDGSFDGIHWHAEMTIANGVSQKCFTSSNAATGAILGGFCADDPTYGKAVVDTMYFGYTHVPQPTDPLEIVTVTLTHNGGIFWSSPYFISDLRLVNPNHGTFSWSRLPKLIDSNGAIITDLARIVAANWLADAKGAATDGVTPILVRVGTSPTVPAVLALASDSAADGTLVDFYGGGGGPTRVAPSMHELDGSSYGVGLYTSPAKFSAQSSAVASRVIVINVEYTVPWQAAPTIFPLQLTLIRPPLVMIHGMWSTPDTWRALQASAAIGGARLIEPVDWAPADAPLGPSVTLVQNSIFHVMDFLRQKQIAATQVDVIAHSAGGPLFRLYAQNPNYKRIDNYMRGDFRKILTVGSPHRGTPIANFVQTLLGNANTAVVSLVQFGFARTGRNLTRGIVADLQTTSATMTSIRPTPGQAHTWVGDLPTLPAGGDERHLWGLLAWICSTRAAQQSVAACAGISRQDSELLRGRVFSFQLNDGLVPHDMQTGGVMLGAFTVLANTPHVQEPQTVSPAEVAGILDGSSGVTDDAAFGKLEGSSMHERILTLTGLLLAIELCCARPAWAAPRGGGGGGGSKGITISAPATASAGQQIQVTVTPSSGVTLASVILLTDQDHATQVKDATPWTFAYTVPALALGTLTVSAMAQDSASDAVYTASTAVQVGTSATLQSLKLMPGSPIPDMPKAGVTLNYYGEVVQLWIQGTFSDGTVRDVSSPASGTTYKSNDLNVVTITPEGGIRAQGLGSTGVVVTNSGKSLTVPVTVDLVMPNTGSLTGGTRSNVDQALAYGGPLVAGSAELPLNSTNISLSSTVAQARFTFYNNSALPQLGVTPGLVAWKLVKGSHPSCSVTFGNNVPPPTMIPFGWVEGTITVTLPPAGGKCVLAFTIVGMSDNQADKFTITNPAP